MGSGFDWLKKMPPINPEKPIKRFLVELVDDKLHVIWALTAVAIVSMLLMPEDSQMIVQNIASGLLGLAVGKGTNK